MSWNCSTASPQARRTAVAVPSQPHSAKPWCVSATIRQGRIVAETHHGFAEWGWLGTATAVRLACGEAVEQFQDIRPRTVYQGNVDDFYPNMTLPDIPWDKIAQGCKR